MTTGKRIKKLRTTSKMTQTELAEAINVTKQTIYKYENDIIANIPYDKLKAIAEIFHVSFSYLLPHNVDYIISENGIDTIIEIQTSCDSQLQQAKYTKRIMALSKFIYNNPEYCELFETAQKIKKEDISLLIELINKMTR